MSELKSKWHNPVAILLLINSDIIRTALAQCAPIFVPVAFSFGWVTYSFAAFAALLGEGRLTPDPDTACKVFNIESGHGRTNKSFLLGRLLRDHEPGIGRDALVVTVHQAVDSSMCCKVISFDETAMLIRVSAEWEGRSRRRWLRFWSSATIAIQIVISAAPWAIHGDWLVFLVTMWGTACSLITMCLQQWRVEAFAARTGADKDKIVAITRGNGSRHVMIVECGSELKYFPDLEDLAAAESPRLSRPWVKYWGLKLLLHKAKAAAKLFPKKQDGHDTISDTASVELDKKPRADDIQPRADDSRPRTDGDQSLSGDSQLWADSIQPLADGSQPRAETAERSEIDPTYARLPLGFQTTRAACFVLLVAWVSLLICVTGVTENTWCLIGVGALGCIQNIYLAALTIPPAARRLPLRDLFSVRGVKVMDVLMDLERRKPGHSKALVKEFFPAGLDIGKNRGEDDWWSNEALRAQWNGTAFVLGPALGLYDQKRFLDSEKFGRQKYGVDDRSSSASTNEQ